MRVSKFTSFRDKVAFNSQQRRNKTANYGHLMLPRGIPVFKEDPGGRVALDFLPYVVTDDSHPDKWEEGDLAIKGSLWYKRPYRTHRQIGAEKTTVVCPTSIGKRCPICEHKQTLINRGISWQDDAVRALRASERSLYYVVPKDHKKFDEKPHIWDISSFLFQSKLDDELHDNPDFGDFPDLQNGLTLRIRFSEEKIGTNSFADTSRIDFEQRDYTYPDDLIEKLASLDDVLIIKDYKELASVFFETGQFEEDEEEDAGPPIQRVAKTDTRAAGLERTATTGRGNGKVLTEPLGTKGPAVQSEPPLAREPQPQSAPRQRMQRPESPPAAVATAQSSNVEECPYGHVFGKDNDKTPECEDCEVWSTCAERKDDLERAAQ